MRWVWLCLVGVALGSLSVFGALLPPAFSPAGGFVRSPCPVTISNPNPLGVVFYTLDGTDPRNTFGQVVTNARSYAEPISVNRSMLIRARAKAGTNWSALVAAPFTVDQDFSKLLFTELLYHPNRGDSGREEFVEFKNVGSIALDLSGLRLWHAGENVTLDPATYVFAPGSILQAGELLVLANDTNTFKAIYGSPPVYDQFEGEFSNGFSDPALLSSNGAVATSMRYETHSPWQVLPDDHGYYSLAETNVGWSLVRATLDAAADPHDPRTWRTSARRFGSPGADDPDPNIPPIRVNELLARSGSGIRDTVELYNPTSTNVHLGGWRLSDQRNWPFKYMIPEGIVIAPQGYLMLDAQQFDSGTNAFSFSAEMDRCYIFSGKLDGTLTGYSHGLEFLGSDRDVSFGRYVDSFGLEHFPQQLSLTLGEANSGPLISPLVISEIMYHPETTNSGEFIELRNHTDAPVNLWDPTRPGATWVLAVQRFPGEIFGLATMFMPLNTTVPPQGHLLLVQDEPEEFRVKFNVPADVSILRLAFWMRHGETVDTATIPVPPGTAMLSERGDVLQLLKPTGASGSSTRYVIVDVAEYRDRFPWPPGADGAGYSLERLSLLTIGNDPANWRPSPLGLSPGRANSRNLAPNIWAGGARTNFVNRIAELGGAIVDDAWPGTVLRSWWVFLSGPAPPQITTNTPDSARVTFSQPGRYVLRYFASDGVFTLWDDAVMDVMHRPIDAWRALHFTAAELANPLVSGDLADPDSDGLLNAEEYLFATNPKAPSKRAVDVAVVDQKLQLTWTQLQNAPDVIINVEWADQLTGPWFGAPELFERTERVAPGPLSSITLRETVPPTTESPQRFFLLRFSLR